MKTCLSKKFCIKNTLLLVVSYTLIFIAVLLIAQKFSKDSNVFDISQLHFENKAQERIQTIEQFFQSFTPAILATKSNQQFQDYIAKGQHQESVENLLITLQKSLNCVAQIKVLDAQGNETIKIIGPATRHTSKAVMETQAVPQSNLGNQFDSPFFQSVMQQTPNSIVTSQMNIVNLQIGVQSVWKPMLKIATPIFVNNQFQGALVLQVCLKDFLKLLSKTTLYDVYLADTQGNLLLEPTNLNSVYPENWEFHTLSAEFGENVANQILQSRSFFKDDLYARQFRALDNTTPYYLLLKAKFTSASALSFQMYEKIAISLLLALLLTIPLSMRLSRSQQQVMSELDHKAHFDDLTLLPNKLSLFEDLQASNESVLVVVSIDHFFELNKVYGYEQTDRFLADFAKQLKAFADSLEYSVYHLEREQFAVILPKMSNQALDLTLLQMKSRLESKALYGSEQTSLKITLSMGQAHFNKALTQPHAALLLAERSLFEARKQQYAFLPSKESLNTSAQSDQRTLWVLEQIRLGAINDQVEVHYQPIQQTQTGKVTKFEALMRLRTLSGEILMPADFLDLAKSTQYYPKLSQQLIQKVSCHLQQLPEETTISVNLSALDLHHSEVMNQLLVKTETWKVRHRLILEVVESESFGDIHEMVAMVNQLHQTGYQLAFDDFGSGYANYQNIIQLAPYFSFLKIDGSIVQPCLTDNDYHELICNIIRMSQSLKLQTVAEFVDSPELAKELKTLGIDFLQGYYIGKPSPDTKLDQQSADK